MKKSHEKIFYSFITRDGYKGNSPKYFNKEDFKWSKDVEDNFLEIKSELDEFIKSGHKLWPYFDNDIVTKENNWKTIPFYAWGVKFFKNCKKAPVTTKVLESIPGMVSASFNLLKEETDIVPHYGDTNAIVRCHLGLVIPTGLPDVGFKVCEEERGWTEGELLLFCDAHLHTAWNHSKEERYILLFDVIRPEFIKKKRRVSSKILASLFLQSLAQKMPFLKKLPIFLQFILFYTATFFAYFIVIFRNALGKLLY